MLHSKQRSPSSGRDIKFVIDVLTVMPDPLFRNEKLLADRVRQPAGKQAQHFDFALAQATRRCMAWGLDLIAPAALRTASAATEAEVVELIDQLWQQYPKGLAAHLKEKAVPKVLGLV